ncbi:hypothetical protein BN2497_2831 [Janthinobacterium sp. CG23_2]|nr:hypothetical protein BN2497_2831 [Janthinobacterium sp. CG23_2]CUU27813.1 hypothetical protein BN3177_2831 [Janthinobacterium sp. CG23_2]
MDPRPSLHPRPLSLLGDGRGAGCSRPVIRCTGAGTMKGCWG